MASRRSFRSLPWLLLLEFLADVVVAVAVPKPLMLGIAEPPGAAARPAGASRPGGGGKPDRSVAGADVILVGFTTMVVVVVFLYQSGRTRSLPHAGCGAAGQRGQTRVHRSSYADSRRGLCGLVARVDPAGSRQSPPRLHPYIRSFIFLTY